MSVKPAFEILCVTMNQHDFSKIDEMNIHSNAVFANQCDHTSYEEISFDGVHTAKMVSTETRGVGKNRNIAFLYADAEICLLADDDVIYYDDAEEKVLKEFQSHPDADVFIFNFDTIGNARKQKIYTETRKCGRFERMPWGGIRIAVRKRAIDKANVWFTTLFGGGCIFPSGEDSLWLLEAKKKGLQFYVSKETIGTISFEDSSWFTGADEKFFYGKGAFCAASKRKQMLFWSLYYYFRTRKSCSLSRKEAMAYFYKGVDGYHNMQPFSK